MKRNCKIQNEKPDADCQENEDKPADIVQALSVKGLSEIEFEPARISIFKSDNDDRSALS